MKYRLENVDGTFSKGHLDRCYLNIFPFPITEETIDGEFGYYIELNTLEDLSNLIKIIKIEGYGHANGILMYANNQPKIEIYDYYVE